MSEIDSETIYPQYERYVRAICYQILGNQEDAEDAVIETFYRVCKNLDAFNPELGTLKSWLASIARHVSADIIRRRRPIGEEVDAGIYMDFENPDSIDLQICLKQLPADQRLALILKRITECTWEEVAELLQCTVEQARYLERQARAQMKNCLPKT